MKPEFTRFNPTSANRDFTGIPANGFVDGVDTLTAQKFNALIGQHNDFIDYITDQSDEVIYVANGGSDTTGDGSVDGPFRTFQKALDSSLPSKRLTIRAEGDYTQNAIAVSRHADLNIIVIGALTIGYQGSGLWYGIATDSDCSLRIVVGTGIEYEALPSGNANELGSWITRTRGSLSLAIVLFSGEITMPASVGTGSTNLIASSNDVYAGTLSAWIDGKVTTNGANGRVLNPNGTYSKLANGCFLTIGEMDKTERRYSLRNDSWILEIDFDSLVGNFYIESTASNLPNCKTVANDRDELAATLISRAEALLEVCTGKSFDDVAEEVTITKDIVTGDVMKISIELVEPLPFGLYASMTLDYPTANDGRFFTWISKRNSVLEILSLT